MAPVITEEDYLKKSKFSIPECFQIPTLPETAPTEVVQPTAVPMETSESSAITFVPPVCPDPIHPNTAQPDSLKSEFDKIGASQCGKETEETSLGWNEIDSQSD